jgi:phage tail sheath gpL-like
VVTTLSDSFNKASSADGTGSAALFRWPAAIAVDSAGNVHVVDAGDNSIRAGSSAAIVPAITAQPVSQVVDAGGSVSFSFAASGTPATLTYQWQQLPSGSSTWTDLTEGSP